MKSQFGKGFIYPLALYMMHLDKIAMAKNPIEFFVAVDGAFGHLRELNIPSDLPKSIVKEIKYLSNRLFKHCTAAPHFTYASAFKGKITKDRERIVYQSKNLCYNIDKQYLKVNPIKGEYE